MKAKNSLLKKIIALFLLLLLPLLLIGFTSLSYANHTLRKQVLSSIHSNDTSYISHLDNSLYTIYATAFNLVDQSNIPRFATMFPNLSTYEQGAQANLLREQISTAQLSLSFCESAHIYFRDLGIVYNSSSYKSGSFSSLSQENFCLFQKISHQKGALHYYHNPVTNQSELAYLLMPSPTSGYGVSFVLSQKELKKYLENNISYKGERYIFSIGDDFFLTNFNKKEKRHYQINDDNLSSDYCITTINGTDYYAFSYGSPHTQFQYTKLIPTKVILNSTHTLPVFMVIFVLILSLICLIFFIGIYKMIHKPLYQLTEAFEEVENGNFSITINDQHNTDFSYLFRAFNNMTGRLSRLIEQDYNQKMLLQKAELKQLQAQINPHFLYNSFFMLQRMIKTELMEEACEMSNALAVYFRYLTRNHMDNVTLETEYEHAKTYAYIQGLRFEGRIRIEFEDLPSDFKNLSVPKLILQPLLENAINYGLNNKMETGLLRVHFLYSENSLNIIVEDNGEELSDETLKTLKEKLDISQKTSTDCEMTGLLNIQRRLSIFSDYTYSLQIDRSSLGGLCVCISLKK